MFSGSLQTRACQKLSKLAPKGDFGNHGKIYIFASTMTEEEKLHIEEETVKMLKTVFDPEIPVDIYSLGLVYKIDVDNEGNVQIDMTLTAPTCPMGDFLFEDIRQKVESIEGVKSVNVQLVFEPEWDQSMMSDEAKMELGML